ncbi:MAG: hypothetical protein RI898_1019, partial [Actinomycetota bacterium]
MASASLAREQLFGLWQVGVVRIQLSIIKWIKAVEVEPQLGGASLGRVGPVTEGLLVWTLGLGLL